MGVNLTGPERGKSQLFVAERHLGLMSAQRDGWRDHAQADCDALARVWAITERWLAPAGRSPEAVQRERMARQIRAAITGDSPAEAGVSPPG